MDSIHSENNYKAHDYMLNSSLSSCRRVMSEQDPKNRNISLALPGGEPNHSGYKKCLWSSRHADNNAG